MAKEVGFSLVYRDMWQSSGRYVPRVDQLREVAPAIIKMGCFDRVETNGGAFEQVNLLFGENPNTAVREWTRPFHEAGIRTHMLERGLNALRMNPVPADVRELMFKVKKAQGTDISRSFCGLNDHRNLRLSVEYAKKAGMVSQVALSITNSPVHTVEYYMGVVDKVVEYGCDEICLKDMAGIGRPSVLGRLVSEIKKKYPHIIVQYHGHTGPGFSPASMLEVARAGADYLDTAVEPLSWGKVHPDIITVREMLKADGFLVKDLDMDAYMEVRSLTQKFIDDFLGYWIDPNNSHMSSLLVGCGLPGGMMGSMMADLQGVHGAINAGLRKQGKAEINLDQLMVKLFQEVEYAWPRLGYPPLVTPFSQYVKNTAILNLMSIMQGKPRWSNIDKDTWNMILGKMGKLPGALAPEIVALAKEKGLEFYEGNPQDAFPDELPKFRQMMKEEGWDEGQDQEELFEFAMHERQYRDYRSGVAKERFNKDLEERRAKAGAPKIVVRPVVEMPKFDIDSFVAAHPQAIPLQAPAKGQILWQLDVDDRSTAPAVGSAVKAGDCVGYVQTYYGMEEITAACDGRILAICSKQGENVVKNEITAFIG
ncbi:MAG: oxaloacetate decarboxylase [Candidatus Cryptobacteroides sp.]|nr:oxaloacetate decarboxylase [Bacteroidales bacterium]MDY2707599.1 oxaloacetate decarboxylase [Candidatus Cryptobacteroides sp.]MCI6315371.1 oxaloacetate decarboxylase [Bacteroidales bacterium]MCI7749346.1 oxaloacetate decarboxylase [Bacteroidales bacterium]MDD6114175.1 oxaloacetate decarboxylase [Bacteroidales bacterium]